MKDPNDDDPQTRDNHATDTNIVASIPHFLQADLLSWLQVIRSLEGNSENLHHRLTSRWRHSVKEADDWLAELNFGTSRRRVANLLLKMRGYKDSRLTTLFSREDMGAMLDLEPETVSREITRLVPESVIEPLDKTKRVYRVLQPERLQAV